MSASKNVTNNPFIEVVALALYNTKTSKYLLARRGPAESGAGDWEFPGGKIESGETQAEALVREIIEELSFDISPYKLSYVGEHLYKYPERDIKIYLWGVSLDFEPNFVLVDHDKVSWYTSNEIKKINLTAGDKFFISLIN